MNFFDELEGKAKSAISSLESGAHPGLLGEVTQLVGGSGGNGLQSLLAQFQANGHGETVASWIGTGGNLPISAEQVQSVLGNEKVAAIAQRLGLSPADVSSALARLLPQAVDQATPNGQVPASNV